MSAACEVHVRRMMVENFHTVGSVPTVCCRVTVKAKLGTFALHGVKMFVRENRVRNKQQSHSFIPLYNTVLFINNGCSTVLRPDTELNEEARVTM